MPEFDYQQAIWGKGTASLNPSDPTAIRLRHCLSALARVVAGGKVLELGCGAGQFIRAIKQRRPDLECHGYDISARAIALAQQAHDEVVYAVGTGENLPYPVAAFDAVVIFDVLEHVAEVDGLLSEIRRVLKSGGIFYCFVPCEGDQLSLWRHLDRLGLKHGLTARYAGHVNFFSRKGLRFVLNQHGFVIKRERYSEHLFGQILGVAAFYLMHWRTRQGGKVINNEAYFEDWKKQSGGAGKVARALVNGLVWLESALLARVPSPNVHLTAKKI